MHAPRTAVVLALLISAATLLVYAPLRHHEFVDYDDPQYVTENPNLRLGLTWKGVANDFEPHFGNWIPLTFLSLRIDHALWGLDPAGYLLTNVALHTLSSLLLFFALGRMTGAIGRSAFVAAVFALHPLHVESVAWVTERKDTLSGLFAMATLYAYARYAEGPPTFARFLPVAIGTALGLLSKSMLVTLPFVLLLLDVWPLGRIRLVPLDRTGLRRAAIEKLPLVALVALFSLVTFAVQRDSGAVYPITHLPLGDRFSNALISYGVYLRQAVWPSGLAAFYPHPLILASPTRAALTAALLGALTLGALRAVPTRPYLAVGWFLYLGMLVPVIGVVQVGMQAHADRYMYLPLVGLSIALAWGAVDSVGRGQRARRALAALAIGALFSLAAATTRQITHWRNSLALHTRVVDVNPHSYRSLNHLGKTLVSLGRYEEARDRFAAALQLAPSWAPPRIGLASVFYHLGDLERAVAYGQLALDLDPNSTETHANLGASLLALGRSAEAAVHFERAIALANDALDPLPSDAMPHFGLAEIALAAGDESQAMKHFEAGLRIDPDNAAAQAKLGALYVEMGRFEEAGPLLERARARGLVTARLHVALGRLAVHTGDPVRGRDHFRVALNMDPEDLEAARRLTRLLATCESPAVRDPGEAVRVGERAMKRANRSSPELLAALAGAYAADGRLEAAVATGGEAARLAGERGDAALETEIRAQLRRHALGRSGGADRVSN